jgi:hypothetical protein
MKKKRKKVTDEDVRRSLGAEYFERHERKQRLLAERIADYDRKLEEKRRAGADA